MGNLKKIFRIIRLIFRINWIKTFYINFKTQRFNVAIRFPIVVFGGLKIYSLRGEIKLNFKPRFGTVLFGKDVDHFPSSSLPIKITNNNKIIFNGPTIISGGCTLTSWNGIIEIGKYTIIGSGNVIKSQKSIKIGNYSRVAANCVVMDTNVHFVLNNKSNEIQNAYGDIEIGEYCWINAGSVLTKGSVLPDYSITARSSFINKNYSANNTVGLLLVGAPAVVKASNLQRIFSFKLESKLKDYFLLNPDTELVSIDYILKEMNHKEEDMDFESYYKLY